ncbi:MAG: aminotransferase class I/II-fold pyridoxal phosphate-dependent enzyme [Candidatus Marinimicrobia bacterium]|nr:aminotransferase class I/II-fold pyridoxal phosphate-dependent enzyme [Candidatus Neomarinimicrobiota bacterium]MBL7023515.1 aminotransferase class I/II-fold pyridoxal phosphate-dependent enzyme [Candidatus Neomarinimicrobiota bacterium]MBL7109417.1 aminotransferase class I/II-fold pyridoxal phosphate-dependent enzyme [Candidatus Neomarinimicrobiota bacterium]
MSWKIKVNQNIVEMEYAVRGPIPQRAMVLRKQGMKTIPCNIGNPQALGQKPITFYRQVLGLLENTELISRERNLNNLSTIDGIELISEDVLEYCENFLSKMETGMGAYTDSKGPLFIRENIAKYIDKRDGVNSEIGVPANPDNIFMTDGASEGAKNILELLITNENDGIMIPIPQYPLYSATIKRCGGVQVNYYPNEDDDWSLNREILDDSYKNAINNGVDLKAIVVINPANPTGAILDEQSIREVVSFANDNNLAIIADEVYQENLYGGEFISFAEAIRGTDIPLFSLHSTSKGFYGECGHRGGYLEVRNPPKVYGFDIPFVDVLFKQASVNLCSNTVGQAMVYMMVTPPLNGTTSSLLFNSEKENILNELHEKALIIKDAFTQMDGVECFGRIGAMYLFPRLNKIPAETTDFDYCMNLLKTTGLTTVNGSGFGQKSGTHHLRIAFLPPKDMLQEVLPQWIKFHNEYVR